MTIERALELAVWTVCALVIGTAIAAGAGLILARLARRYGHDDAIDPLIGSPEYRFSDFEQDPARRLK